MRQLGFAVPIDELGRARDHGVTAQFDDRLTVEDLVMLRDHGLSPERIRTANERAGTRLPIDLLKSLAR